MARVRLLPRLVDRDPQQIRPQDLPFLPHNLSKEVMGVIQAISNRDMGFTAAKPAVSTPVLVELEDIKPPVKGIKTANMEATKLSAAIIMATASNVADGVATTDTNWLDLKWLHVLG